jgi:O-methyltransferase
MIITKIKLFIQRVFAKFLESIGVVVYKKSSSYSYLKKGTYVETKPGYSYVETKPGYSYMPDYFMSTRHKQVDIRTLPEFGELASQVVDQSRTLLGYDRLYTIYQSLRSLKRLTIDNQAINLAEIGVYRGGASRFIALCANAMNLNARLHSFDTFEGHANVDIKSDVDREDIHTPGLFKETDFDKVSSYLQNFSNILLYKGRFQDTSLKIEQEQFHFVHSDVDLYGPTLYILEFMNPRLASKGIIVVDDYGNSNCPGVVQAVEEFSAQNKNFTVLGILTGQCILIKD